MIARSRPLRVVTTGRIGLGPVVRAAAILAVGAALVLAATRPGEAQIVEAQTAPAQQVGIENAAVATLRGDVVVSGDVVHFGDLVAGIPADVAGVPVFHAPALGSIGTIQVERVLVTATALGIPAVETGGRDRVTVTRAARRVGHDAIAAALTEALAGRVGFPVGEIEIVFEGTPPMLLTLPETIDPVAVTDLAFDPASRRFTGTAFVGPSAAERRAQAPVSGVVRRVVDVAVLTRSIGRGEPIVPGDYAIERRPADRVNSDARFDALDLADQVARRPLQAGSPVRAADLERPMLVERNAAVLMVYESGALTLTLRGRARQAGAKGDLIDVENPTTERILQAEVIGPGAVRVGPAFAGRVAALATR